MRKQLYALIAAIVVFGFVMVKTNTVVTASEMTPQPAVDWSGFYIGGGFGAALYDYDIDTKVKGKETRKEEYCYYSYKYKRVKCRTKDYDKNYIRKMFSESDEEINGFGTIQISVKRQLNEHIVVGAFADVDKYIGSGSNIDVSHNHYGAYKNVNGSIDLDYSATIGATIGWLVHPNTLLYGLVGYTYLKLDNDLSYTSGYGKHQVHQAGLGIENELEGLTLGAGIERKLSENSSIKFEYRYTNLDDESLKTAIQSEKQFCCKRSGKGYKKYDYKLHGKSNSELDSDLHSVRAVLVFKLHRKEQHVPLK